MANFDPNALFLAGEPSIKLTKTQKKNIKKALATTKVSPKTGQLVSKATGIPITQPIAPVTTGLGKQLMDSLLAGIKAGTPLQQVKALVSPQFLNVIVPKKIRAVEEEELVKKGLGGGTAGGIAQFISDIIGNVGAGLLETPTVELGREVTGERASSGKALLEGIIADIAGQTGKRKELFEAGARESLGQYGRSLTPEELMRRVISRQRSLVAGTGMLAGEVGMDILGGVAVRGLGKVGVKAATPVLDDLVKGFKKVAPLLERIGQKIGKVADEPFGQFLKRTLVDKFAPLEKVAREAAEKLPFENNFYKRARLFAGISGKYDELVEKNLGVTLKRESARLEDLSALTYLQRAQELLRRGIKVMPEEDISKGISELRDKYGTEGLATLRQSAEEVTNFGKVLLKDMRDSGLISHVEFTRLSKAGEYWVPLEVVADGMDKLAKGQFTGKSFNVSSRASILTAIKGGTGEVRKNPLMTLMRRGLSTTALAEKNRIVRSIGNSGLTDVVEVKSVKAAEELGLKAISYFDNGIKKILAVSEPIEMAVKNLSEPSLGLFTKALTYQAKVLRAGATALNLAFIPKNVVRDLADALFTKSTRDGVVPMLQFIRNYPEGLLSSIGKGKWATEFFEAGSAQSALTTEIFRDPEAYIKKVAGRKGLIAKVLASPADAIRYIGRVGEESTRLAEFITQRKAGRIPAEAALASRDITVDFARSGSFIQAANRFIPFLNAGVQSLVRITELAVKNPVRFATSMTMFVGVPAVGLYTHNKQFKDYDLVPDWEKNTSWIIMLRNRTEEEVKNNSPVRALKIPTGFFFMPAKVAIERALDFASGKDPGVLKTLGEILEVTSPASLSQSIPPGLKALGILTGATEKDIFTGARIIPRGMEDVKPSEQFGEKTQELFVRLGKLLNTSPAKLQAAWQSQTAGGGKMLTDLVSQLFTRTLPKPEQELRSGELGKIPGIGSVVESITKGFYGATPADEERYEEIGAARTEAATRLLQERRETERIFEEITSSPNTQARFAELVRSGEVNEDMVKRIKVMIREKLYGITTMDKLVKSVSPPERAQIIANDLAKITDETARREYLEELVRKGILTTDVIQELQRILGR